MMIDDLYDSTYINISYMMAQQSFFRGQIAHEGIKKNQKIQVE